MAVVSLFKAFQVSPNRLNEVRNNSAMQPEVEAALTQHLGEIAMILEETSSGFKVAVEVEHGDDRLDHDFGIAHLALPVFGMVKGF